MLYNLSFIRSLVFIFSLFFVIENNIYSQEKTNFVNVKVVNPKLFVFKNEIKIAMVSTIAASLELAKKGEINLKQEKEFGEILLKKRK